VDHGNNQLCCSRRDAATAAAAAAAAAAATATAAAMAAGAVRLLKSAAASFHSNVTVRASFYRGHKRETARIVKLKTRRRFYKATVTAARRFARTHRRTHSRARRYKRARARTDGALLSAFRARRAYVCIFNVSYSSIYTEDQQIKHHPFRLRCVMKRLLPSETFAKGFPRRRIIGGYGY